MNANTLGIIVLGLLYIGVPLCVLWAQRRSQRRQEERPTPAHVCMNAGTDAGACKKHCGDKERCWGNT